MRKTMRAKLKSRAGESIAETLIALLISALALLMLAGAISSAATIVVRSNTQMGKYYEADNALAEQATGTGGTIKITDGTISITRTDIQGGKSLKKEVVYYENPIFSGVPVISYKIKKSPAGD